MKFAVVMYTSKPGYFFERSIKSFRDIGRVNPLVMGMGDYPFSYAKKFKVLAKLAVSQAFDCILVVDAWDTCCLKPLNPMMEELEDAYGFRYLVVGAETNCFPDRQYQSSYPQVPGRYKFLNAGVYFFECSYFCKLVKENGWHKFTEPPECVDQLELTKYYVDNPENGFHLDTKCRFIHNLVGAEDDWEILNGKYRVKSTGSFPYISHGNGKSNIGAVLTKMGA